MGIFGSVILKLLFFKMGFFVFVILKLILKNISNSFYKGIEGYFEIILPLNPQLDPPKRPLFLENITCYRKLFYH
ncbi:hypothetical protein EC518_01740 [Helicobacter pylori]|uniref:Uncharacterized protein n=1 Tax=Helicobacter pylori TaxID=210 RepID=A0A438XZJ5_HELPX|nr:hypothetical protein EC518_01740 [Helicobacter pylori]